MRIGYFSSKFPYSEKQSMRRYLCGGSVLATYYLALEIAKRGYKVKIFTTSYGSKDCIEEHNSLEIYRYSTNIKLLTSNISLGLFYKPSVHTVDIVHVSFDIPPGPFAGLRYAKKKGLPLVITYHGDWEESYGNVIRRLGVAFHNKFLVDKILSYAKVIISPSKVYVNASRFLRKYKDKVVVVPNGINLEDFDIPYSKEECRKRLDLPIDKNILLFFGYLSPYKSPDILLKALPKILEEIPDTLLVFAGSGVMEKGLERLSVKLGVGKNVKFTGFVGKERRSLYYKAADIFCLPSTMSTECYPLAILEAMTCGTPIVVSKIGGIPDVVKNGENGLLVPPKDSEKLIGAITYLLENKDIREKMGKSAKVKMKNYSWRRIAEETEKVYQQVYVEGC